MGGSWGTYVRRVLEQALRDGVLEALNVLVDLALLVEDHGGGRLRGEA